MSKPNLTSLPVAQSKKLANLHLLWREREFDIRGRKFGKEFTRAAHIKAALKRYRLQDLKPKELLVTSIVIS